MVTKCACSGEKGVISAGCPSHGIKSGYGEMTGVTTVDLDLKAIASKRTDGGTHKVRRLQRTEMVASKILRGGRIF